MLVLLSTAMEGIWISWTLPSAARELSSSTLDFQEPIKTMAAWPEMKRSVPLVSVSTE